MIDARSSARLAGAVRNNAVWCDAVCRAHGCPGDFAEAVWINHRQAPRFYPNVITLDRERQAEQEAAVGALVDSGLPGAWGVKDSFGALGLESLGFAPLFDASWIWRPADLSAAPVGGTGRIRWAEIADAQALANWEGVWESEPEANAARVFVPDLLNDANVAVLAAYDGNAIVAGVIGYRSEDVVGISNLFIRGGEADLLRSACLAAVMAAFPGLPLCGYESGADLAAAQAMGFELLGPLRVWQRSVSAPLPPPSPATR